MVKIESNVKNIDVPFFIVGADRSGTTMLRLMLNQHPRLHIPRETGFIEDLIREFPLERSLRKEEVKKCIATIVSHKRWPDLEIETNILNVKILNLSEPNLSQVIDCVFRLSMSHTGKARWGDKTPTYLNYIDKIHTIFPNAKFVHILRDGRDVCISLRQKGWVGNMTWQIAKYWSNTVKNGAILGRSMGHDFYREFQYEDIVKNPGDVLGEICNFIGETFDPCMLDFYKNAPKLIAPWEKSLHGKTMRAPSINDICRWPHELTSSQVIIFEAVAGRTMDIVGQQRKYQGSFSRIRNFFVKVAIEAIIIFIPLINRLGIKTGLSRYI